MQGFITKSLLKEGYSFASKHSFANIVDAQRMLITIKWRNVIKGIKHACMHNAAECLLHLKELVIRAHVGSIREGWRKSFDDGHRPKAYRCTNCTSVLCGNWIIFRERVTSGEWMEKCEYRKKKRWRKVLRKSNLFFCFCLLRKKQSFWKVGLRP